jgi:hypothetical protein
MATKAKTSGQQAEQQEGNGTKTEMASDQGTAEDVRPSQPAEGRAEGPRSATLNLPFVTAQFRAPDLHVPSRQELGSAARGAQSMMPSRSSMLFFGGLAVTAAVGAIEWPVAAAIGVGSALASRGAADPRPRSGTPQMAETAGPSGNGGEGKSK